MNPLIEQILGGLVRVVLGGVIAWMIQRGIISEDQTPLLIGGITTALGTAGWIVWNKVKGLRELNTFGASPKGTTLAEAQESVKAGTFAAALTPKDVVPIIRNNTGDGGPITGTGDGK